MEREFLKSLGIEDSEVGEKIMRENGADIEREKAKASDLSEKQESAKATISTYESKITRLESATGEMETTQ